MLKPLLAGACFAALVAGCAVQPQAHTESAAQNESAVAALSRKKAELDCVRSTGTRITLKDDECANVPGRTYSKEDLDRTGAITPAEALRRLDPSITTSGW